MATLWSTGSHQPPLGEPRCRHGLARYTSWNVGGPAEFFAEPRTLAELQHWLAWAGPEGLSLHSIGAGSNLLISDEGLAGLTLCLRSLRQAPRIDRPTGLVEVDAGEPLPSLAHLCARAGLAGLEWAVGIPGTVGGAVVMNAGAQGGSMAQRLVAAELLDPASGALLRWSLPQLDYAYRQSRLQLEESHGRPRIVLRAWLQLEPGHDPLAVQRRTNSNRSSRIRSQPYTLPSCGSVFRNPEPQKAGRLIEDLGLMGLSIGGAQVSTKHANFIVNTGGATAADIDALIRQVQARVLAERGISLHPEVKRLGPFSDAEASAAAERDNTAGGSRPSPGLRARPGP
ncbi:MAG: UDP-N-acetylmuramate dehydrogenase [Aphanocapsa feldmannii 288cV]|nr:MAG: UDP-N-acetylmuramate dehydrogenase [Aphanocapsa feldmannii 288cV]